jgi:hypothetical protein
MLYKEIIAVSCDIFIRINQHNVERSVFFVVIAGGIHDYNNTSKR